MHTDKLVDSILDDYLARDIIKNTRDWVTTKTAEIYFTGLEARSPRAGVGGFDFSEASSLGWQMTVFLLCGRSHSLSPDRCLLPIIV